ncbi:MAG: GspH/FimT family pseudopilin [Woeseia sp.]
MLRTPSRYSVWNGQRPPCHRGAQRGLTIVELILVIVIIGVLGALAGPRFFNNQTFAERAYAEELASALRYAQKVAVGSGCRVQVSLGANSYSLAQQAAQSGHCNPADATFPLSVALPTGQAASGNAPSGVSASPAATFVFDATGSTNLAGDIVISVGTHSLDLRAGSGLVRGPQ